MSQIKTIMEGQRLYFNTGVTKSINFRVDNLNRLKKVIIENEAEILEAIKKDLNKAPFEAYETEIGMVLEELNFMIKNIKKWAKPKRVHPPIMHFLSKTYTVAEPYGITLIMSPWNYPFQLTMAPLVGAIAGGNCAVIKPSAFSPNTSKIISDIIKDTFEQSYITVIQGGRAENEALLEEKFDYIFFTGSVEVGKVVMTAAAKYLTPVTLELGGKSPCIVNEDANIDLAAKRIVWGKFLNCGQTCVAPDYILVQKNIKKDLIEAMKKYICEFYGENPCVNNDFPKVINEKHFNRLLSLIKDLNILIGGKSNPKTLQISPTIIDNVTWNHGIMKEEIFGPLLPILEFENIDEVIKVVNSHPKPLALYLFTNCKDVEKEIVTNISFGGGCINDTIVHLASSYMPFGGVGESGMGSYHGKASFHTFTHTKSILKKSNAIDINLRYPPYKEKLNLLKKFM